MNPDLILAVPLLITAVACIVSEAITQRRIRQARAAENERTLAYIRGERR